jgi:hypothetical protein
MNQYLHYYFEFLSLLIAGICFGKLRKSFLALFLPYLLLTLLVELFAGYLYQTYKQPTGWMYNILNLSSHIFYSYIYFKYSSVFKHKRFILILSSIYLSGSVAYYLSTTFYQFSNWVIVAGGVLQVILSCLYFYEYLQNDAYVKEKHYSSGLWVASGVLMFYSGITICFSLYHYILLNHLRVFDLPLYNVIPRILSIILYSCISIALITWKKPRKI